MTYLPKSKYQIKETGGGEFIDPRNGLEYIGPYIETNSGYYAGKNPNNTKVKLQLKSRSTKRRKGKINNILETEKTPEYAHANIGIVDFIKNTQPIIATKSIPTNEDLKRGYYIRYFAKRNNSLIQYYEIDKQTYKLLSTKQSTYDFNLYSASRLRWALDGDILNINRNTLLRLEQKYPNISSLFPKLNEYQVLRYARLGKLTYEDGTPFEGYYHIHLGKPMEGQYHSDRPHKNLIFVEKDSIVEVSPFTEPGFHSHGPHDDESEGPLYQPPKEVQEQVTQVVQSPSVPMTTPSTPGSTTPMTPSTPSYGGGSSGGGGGGY